MPVRLTGQSLGQMSLASAAISTEVSITATTSGTANTCISTGAFALENAGTYQVIIFVPYLTKGSTNLDVELWDGATLVTTVSGHLAANVVSPATYNFPVSLTAGSHNLTVKAFVDAGTGKYGANNGATGNPPNATLNVYPG